MKREPLFTWRFLDALLVLMWGMLFAVVTLGVIAASVPWLGKLFSGSTVAISWMVTASLLGATLWRASLAYELPLAYAPACYLIALVVVNVFLAKSDNSKFLDAAALGFFFYLACIPGRWLFQKIPLNVRKKRKIPAGLQARVSASEDPAIDH